ncbi:MAG: hypothetical protein IPI53_06750 [Saprospiraceae bacterium]|nr:hypothetical protein [Saprospiraceae bacterium]
MKTRILLFSFLLLVWIFSCGKEDANTELGGDTNIPLTKVDSVSNVYLNYNGTYLGSTTMKVVSNNNGEVTYNAKMDLKTFPNDLKLKALEYLPKVQSYYNVPNLKITPDQQIEFDFKLKITSEGYLDYFTDGKPWVMIKYENGVGAEYKITNNKGQELSRKITEKTGIDDYPFGFLLIKTTKVEHIAPADNPVFSKVTYRANHKFGLVDVEFVLKDKDETKFGIDIRAFFL